MSTDTETGTDVGTDTALEPWQGGVIGGLLGGLVFGAMMTMQMTPVIETAIPAMYGFGPDAGAIGWLIHMSHAAVLGTVFAAVVDLAGLDEQLDDNLRNGVAGLAYGIVVWIGLAVVVMPLWLQAVGFGGAPDVPNIGVESLLGHAVYGVVLGIAYSVLSD